MTQEQKILKLARKHDCNITLFGVSGEVGKLEWEDGKIKFTGNYEESAKIFFENFLQETINRYTHRKEIENENRD